MDHLPSVSEPYQPIEVPFLGGGGSIYDGLDFAGYPARKQWQVDDLLAGDLQCRTPIQAAQFLQRWLYFGMIREALTFHGREEIPYDDFVRTDQSDQSIVSTRRLPELLTALITKIKAAKARNEHTAYFERFRTSMELSCSVWRSLMEDKINATTRQLLSPKILLSIQILGVTLDIGITEVCKSDPKSFDYTWRTIPRSGFLMKRMVSQGWCPSVVEQLSRPCMVFLYYVSLLGPPSIVNHSRCEAKSRSCAGKNVDSGNYEIRHVLKSCKCNHVLIETGEGSKLANAIQNGDIPIIHLRDEGSDIVVDIDVHSPSNPIAYTAISHV